MNIYITGDTHCNFERIYEFCKTHNTSRNDIMIILGDVGLNFWLDERDTSLKESLLDLNITLFMIHGNHEQRPNKINTYIQKKWYGGTVFYEEKYPHLLFAKDGDIYNLNEKKVMCIGGAYSIDKYYRLKKGYRWYDTEQPSNDIKSYVESQLSTCHWNIDYIFSHCAPLKFEPQDIIIPEAFKLTQDKSTEKWLDFIETKTTYTHWFCGHYHKETSSKDFSILFESIKKL